jgi:predicted Zn-dependent protease
MKRFTPWILTALTLVLVLAAIPAAWPKYRRHQEKRGLQQARQALSCGNFANASLSARRVLQLNKTNIDACRILAELSHSPTTVDWRQRIAELEPTLNNRLKLASSALRFQHPPYSIAEQTLGDLQATAGDVAAFHVLSAELALKLDRVSDAVAHFEEAARIEPGNELHRLNLAVVQLQSTNLGVAAGALLVLERLSTNHNLGPLALRWRIVQSVRQQDFTKAESLSRQLLLDPRASVEDRLEHLSLLQQSGRSEFTNFLQSLQAGATTNAAQLYALSEWMGTHELADDALAWLGGFDVHLRQAQPVPLARANLLLAKQDWPGLADLIRDQQWPDLEFLRLAFLARAAWGQNQSVAGDAHWRGAVRAAGGKLGPLTLLLSLAVEWGRDPEDLLWQIGQRFPREQWALLELEKQYHAAGNTRGLNKVYSALMGTKPNQMNSTNKNNFATSSLLLKVNLARAHEIARDLYDHAPGDSVIASTYAYSLHLQGRTEDGLAVLKNCRRESLETPTVALYYGVLLSAAGHPEQARRFLALAQNAPLLPEENELLAEARAQDRD